MTKRQEEVIDVYITKYALTQGLHKKKAVRIDSKLGTVRVQEKYGDLFFRKEYALTEEEALAMAEEMRRKKILSLEKQLKKVKALQFETTDDVNEEE